MNVAEMSVRRLASNLIHGYAETASHEDNHIDNAKDEPEFLS
jgi:hypothetical protein